MRFVPAEHSHNSFLAANEPSFHSLGFMNRRLGKENPTWAVVESHPKAQKARFRMGHPRWMFVWNFARGRDI
jgi:hypothetical protein